MWVNIEIFTIPFFILYALITNSHYKINQERAKAIYSIGVMHAASEQVRGLAASFKEKLAEYVNEEKE